MNLVESVNCLPPSLSISELYYSRDNLVCIACDSLAQVRDLFKQLHKFGFTWASGEKLFENGHTVMHPLSYDKDIAITLYNDYGQKVIRYGSIHGAIETPNTLNQWVIGYTLKE